MSWQDTEKLFTVVLLCAKYGWNYANYCSLQVKYGFRRDLHGITDNDLHGKNNFISELRWDYGLHYLVKGEPVIHL